jgi:putative inorganic carbon (HCO3(-)) transporter
MTKINNKRTKKQIVEPNDEASYLSYLTGLYLFFFYMEASLRWPAFEAVRFHFVFGLILTILCSFKLLSNSKTVQSKLDYTQSNSLKNTALLLIFILFFYSIFSVSRDISLEMFDRKVFKFSLISFFIVMSVSNIRDLKVIVLFIMLAWFKICLEGGHGWITGSLMVENQGIMRLRGAGDFVQHPNSFSAFGVGCLPFAIYLFQASKIKLLKYFFAVLLVLSIIIIIFTGSRSGYVAVLLAAIYFFFKMKEGKFKVFFLSSILFVALAPIVPEQYYDRFESIYSGKEAQGNSSGTRKIIMEDALEIYLEYPMGIGVNTFSVVRMEMFNRKQNIHMLYLEVLTNIGPIGFIVFMLFIKKLLLINNWNIKQSLLIKNDEFSFVNGLAKAMFAYLVLRMIFGLFGMDLYEPHWWLILGLSIASYKLIISALKKEKEKEKEKETS